MANQPDAAIATGWAVITPEWGNNTDRDGRRILVGAKFDKITRTRPQTMPRGGGVVMKLRIILDADCLLPLVPDVEIHVHAGDVETIRVEVDPPVPEEDS